jgi:hypothetical protein
MKERRLFQSTEKNRIMLVIRSRAEIIIKTGRIRLLRDGCKEYRIR